MTAVNPSWVIQASSHSADIFRRQTRMLALGSQGCRLAGDLAVTANGTPNMTVNVAAGEAIINGTENATSQGAYEALNDATVNLAIAASDPTNPRIDIVVAKVQDAQYSGATNAWSLAVVTGTPAGSPAAPATPNNAIVLAQIAVAANATTITSGNITDKRPFLSLASAMRISAIGTVITGSTPTVGPTAWLTQGGTAVVTTNGSGDFTFTWPTAFPNGVLTAGLWAGDISGGLTSAAINGSGATDPLIAADVR